MSALPDYPQRKLMPEEYLAFERASDEKHEYLDGEIVAMAGAKPNHNRITALVIRTLLNQLIDHPCDVFSSDQQVKLTERKYVYPDVTVVCGEPEFSDDEYMLLNPTLVIEVLSPSTEGKDRGKKFRGYQERSTIQEVLFIAQDERRIDHYLRQPDERWLLTVYIDPNAVIDLSSIGCALKMADVYAKVTFAEPPEQEV